MQYLQEFFDIRVVQICGYGSSQAFGACGNGRWTDRVQEDVVFGQRFTQLHSRIQAATQKREDGGLDTSNGKAPAKRMDARLEGFAQLFKVDMPFLVCSADRPSLLGDQNRQGGRGCGENEGA